MLCSQVININRTKLKVAHTHFQKLRGLYFHPKGTYIFLFGCSSIHTMFFFRKIDVAFLSKDLMVLKSVRNLPPWSFSNCKDSRIVIERFSSNNEAWFEVGEVIDV